MYERFEIYTRPECVHGSGRSCGGRVLPLGNGCSFGSYELCSREANMLADGLAKHCFSNSTSEFWKTFVPDFILHNYVNDLAII